MEALFFYIFAAAAVGSALLVVANPFSRNPVTSAIFLVGTMVALAGLFVLLHAFFVAAVQILVYAGAVMVLFLFVIMLLDVKEEQRRKIRKLGLLGAVVAAGSVLAILVTSIRQGALGVGANPQLEGETPALGRLLFTEYLLPFEIVGVLLLVAMVGVILLSKREVK